MEVNPDQYLPTMTAKNNEREQLAKDVQAFLDAGGTITTLPPAKMQRSNTANVKKSTE